MSPEIDLRVRLDDELDLLPTVPPEAYLREGRRARRRRRSLAVAGLAAAAAVSVAGVQLAGPGGADRTAPVAGDTASPPSVRPGTASTGPASAEDPDFVAPEPNNPVEAVEGLDGVDWFTTEDVPPWAQEHGSHGPVALTPEGRLWVAPEATVLRTVVDPYPPGVDGIAASYAVEALFPRDEDDDYRRSDTVWVIISTDGTSEGHGWMDDPGRWTDDFELWVDDATASHQDRPSFAERLVRFADDDTSAVVAGAADVRIVREQLDPALGPDWVRHRRAAAVEVVTGGQTWYAVAVDPGDGGPWSQAFQADVAPDFDAFLDLVARRYP